MNEEIRQRTKWFMDGRFGMFIHWGLYAIPARGEWVRSMEQIPHEDYCHLTEEFTAENYNPREWARLAKKAGMKYAVLTAKHHDGFCLWPTRYTRHSVASSPWKKGTGDVVKEVSDACRRHGMKFGIYLSPWDRNQPCYGTGKEYDDYYLAQLTELLTGYGEIFSVWLDGACGEGPNGKKQVYDWERYYACVRKYQPDACICVCGPDIRWCGNEA